MVKIKSNSSDPKKRATGWKWKSKGFSISSDFIIYNNGKL
jgi:hypothetical protein